MNLAKSRWMIGTGGVAAAMVVLWGLLLWQYSRPLASKRLVLGEINRWCANEFCMTKNVDGWIIESGVNKLKGNNEVIEDFTEKLTKLTAGEIISTNLDKFADLGIGVSTTEIFVNGTKIELGRVNSNYDGIFVRLNDKKEVRNLDEVFDKNKIADINTWVDLKLAEVEMAKVKKILVDKKEIFIRDKNWKGLMALRYLSDFKEGLLKYQVQIVGDNIDLKLMVGNTNNTLFWATINSQQYFEISKEDYQLLTGKFK